MQKAHIPVIDLFAGPGGLGEGFSSLARKGARPFRIAVSVEMNEHAHRTLSLRAFYRWFLHEGERVPDDYYRHLAGEIDLAPLFSGYPDVHAAVKKEVLCAELGNPEYQPKIDDAIRSALSVKKDWVLIGGPPCQAYSLVGRARMQNAADYKKKQGHDFSEDHRHQLYQQYLRIIAMHQPSIFVMENVKGILSSKLNGELIFPKIREDLSDPYKAGQHYGWNNIKRGKYHIVSFVTGTVPKDLKKYLIRSEDYGIPQARHRVILLGIRDNVWKKIGGQVTALQKQNQVSVNQIIGRMPALRSGFSKRIFSAEVWVNYFHEMQRKNWVRSLDPKLRREVISACKKQEKATLKQKHNRSGNYSPAIQSAWYRDQKMRFIPNHETRTHMDMDLDRYMFVSAFGKVHGSSPRLKDFPKDLLPAHKNVQEGIKSGKFADRFKVQLAKDPASTITSHISKDGHYFIHPDPVQCRSLTVREAARIQTFPDNYFFEGGRTQQYHQVGNAVPPLLATQLAKIVYEIFVKYAD